MKKSSRLTLFLVIAVVALLLFIMYQPKILGDGSPWPANRLAKRFKSISDPNQAERQLNPVKSKYYSDGSWIFGTFIGSHGVPWGGTVVTKDSAGKTRAFFGHVCSRGVLDIPFADSNCPNDVYTQFLSGYGLKEHDLSQ